jgi:hypothetical protein
VGDRGASSDEAAGKLQAIMEPIRSDSLRRNVTSLMEQVKQPVAEQCNHRRQD